jgi:Tol biopolymer transport system component
MSLAPGLRLGPYEILSPLGAGGMGEVYRARDTRLLRDVAVKVVPQHLSSNLQVRTRFEREARAVSSLNHPHICTLFDVGRAGEIDYLVMELVEGETLAARLKRGPLPLGEVLRLATQIALALEVAHRAGVVHRDLKPGNVMLTKTGAKLMDFGLAKGAGPRSPADGLTAAPTATSPLTAQGTIVGTFQYMAPELLDGNEADARSDLFALGLVLYEMATGRPAFDGKTQASIIAAILKGEPAPIASTNALFPPALDHLVRQCLRKDPDERMQSAHDVRLRLEEIAEAGPTSPSAAVAAAPTPKAWLARFAWGIAALATAVAIVAVSGVFRKPAASAPLVVSSIPTAPGSALVVDTLNLALAPDGRSLAYVARGASGGGLWVRSLDGTQAKLVVPAEDVGCPFWSPDGRSLGFASAGRLRKLDLASGQNEILAPVGECYGAWWGSDGSILYVPDPFRPIHRIPASGGPPQIVNLVQPAGSNRIYYQPSLLPDRRHILYTVQDDGIGAGESGIFVATIDGKDERRLLSVPSNARFVPQGYLIYGREGVLRAQKFDPDRLALSGEPIPLFERVQYVGFYQSYVFSISDTGLMTCVEGTPSLLRQFTWVDRKGVVTGTVGVPGNYFSPRISPDGSRIAYDQSDAATDKGDIWVFDVDRGIPTRLTFTPHNESSPVWSPDGSRILFYASLPERGVLFTIGSDDRGSQETVLSSRSVNIPSDWSPDGQSMLTQSNPSESSTADVSVWSSSTTDLSVFSVKDGKAEPWLASPFAEKQARFSPDGRWIAYNSDESGRTEVYVRTVASSGGKWRVSSAGGDSPVWSRDGRELFYLSPEAELMSVAVAPGPTFRGGAPVTLFRIPGELMSIIGVTQYDIAPDGRRFLMNLNQSTQGTRAITLVSNWTTLLKAR